MKTGFGAFMLATLTISVTGAAAAPRVEALAAKPGANAARAIGEIVDSFVKGDLVPGASVAISIDGKLVFAQGYGIADLEHRAPVRPETSFNTGSMGKQFTAAGVLLLAEQGALSLDDRLSRFMPGFPRADEVTIRQLLSHTSGITDYVQDGFIGGNPSRVVRSPEEMIAFIKTRTPLYEFEPGAAWGYSNSNFVILASVIERVTGSTYEQFIAERVLGRAGLTDVVLDDAAAVVPHRAEGYRKGTPFRNAEMLPISAVRGAGGFRATAADLVKWEDALVSGRVISAESVRQMMSPARLLNGRVAERMSDGRPLPFRYGLGAIASEPVGGREAIGNGGFTPGFNTWVRHFPSERMTVAVVVNMTGQARELAAKLVPIIVSRRDELAAGANTISPDGRATAPQQRIAKVMLATMAGGGAAAQQPSTEAATTKSAAVANPPAMSRMRELLQAIDSGDDKVIRAYLDANAVDPVKVPAGPPQAPKPLPLLGKVLDLQRRSRGLELVRIVSVADDRVVAIVRNKLSGDEQPLAIAIEPQAPHRITQLPAVPLSVAASLTQVAPAGPTEAARLEQIGSYLQRLSDADIFSGVVLIAREGAPVFARAYGLADREKGTKNTVETPFNLGSINKLMTGLAIGRLVEEGKLSYEDPLSRFVPDFPDPETAQRIRIKHLLSHTAGLDDGYGADFFKNKDRLRSIQAFIDAADRKPLMFEPGTRWSYSNLGYQLLGRVIEVVTGDDYYDHMKRRLFSPAGMKNADFPQFDRDNVEMAHPYEIEFDGTGLRYQDKSSYLPRGSAAGLGIASATDLLKLAKALQSGRIVKPETYREHLAPKPELGSPLYGYGFGVGVSARVAKRPFVGHGGSAPGVCNEFGMLTDTPYTIIILSNSTTHTCVTATRAILQALPPSSSSSS